MKRKINILIVFALCINNIVKPIDYVFISEVLYDSPLNENMTQVPYCFGEFIELYNINKESVNLTGWQLTLPRNGQSYTLPDVVLKSKSFLIIAFGSPYSFADFVSIEDKAAGWTDFHVVFNIEPGTSQVLFQTQMTLPNDTCTLVLKDNSGKIRDYVKYGENPSTNIMIANNIDYADVDDFWSSHQMTNSIQRMYINFDLQGCALFHFSNWSGMYGDPSCGHNSPAKSNVLLTANIITSEIPEISVNNYIITVTPTIEMDSIPVVNNMMQLDNIDAMVNIDYYDGLGRLRQNMQKAVTPQKKNLINYMENDVYDRPVKKWLPIAVDVDYMGYQQFTNASNLYYPNESRAYTEYKYSTDMLSDDVLSNELIGIQQPGADMNNHYVAKRMFPNEANAVKYFCINFNNNMLRRLGFYDAKTLLSEHVTDEDGKVIRHYRNKKGQVIMIRKGTNYDTYYVYDDLGNLRYVLPPLAADALIDGHYDDNYDILRKYAYIYKYDERGNCIKKYLPGCEPVHMVYDKANRLILSQDGNQRYSIPKQWTIHKYDIFGRLLYTGLINREIQESEKQNIQSSIIRESYIGGPNSGFAGTGYTCNSFPGEISLLTANYYDNYNFLEIWPGSITNDLVYQEQNSYGTAYAAYPIFGNEYNCKNYLTGTINRIIGTNNFLYRIDYFDDRGRLVQVRSTNHLGGYNFIYNQYDFSGNVTKMQKQHSATGQQPLTEVYTYIYDHALRLKMIKYKLNNNDTVLLVSNLYDDLGRLTQKKRHNGTDIEEYSYNIRNWPTKIRSGSTFEQNLYYNSILPNNLAAQLCYNGNISSTTWTYNGNLNGYMYYYDALNRLTSNYAIVNNQFMVDYQMSESFNYDKHGNIVSLHRWDNQDETDVLALTYNGNQLKKVTDNGFSQDLNSIKQYQDLSGETTEFDYDKNGNMTADLDRNIVAIRYNLLNLPDTIQFGNGNQILNRYSADGQKLSTTYITAPLNVVVPINSTVNSQGSNYTRYGTKYCGNIEYEFNNAGNTSLKRINNDEGYVDFEPGGSDPTFYFDYRYNYYRKDHLGNVREVWRAPYSVHFMDGGGWGQEEFPAQTVQLTQYYPSGLPWKSNSGDNPGEQAYKYGEKEFVEMHGLDEYDSDARWYYPAIMRTTTIDPLAEKYYDVSPYAWCGNNPMNRIDPDGMDWFYHSADGKADPTWIWHDGSTYNTGVKDSNGKDVILQGQEAVVVFDGSKDEKLGEDGTLTGKGAKSAEVTIYGIGGKDDIKSYNGLTVSSDPSKYSMVASGDYNLSWEQMATSPYGKGSLTYRVRQLDGNAELPIEGGGKNKATGKSYLGSIFFHRTNWNGGAKYSSQGCLIIDGRQWRNVEKQLDKSKDILLQIKRK